MLSVINIHDMMYAMSNSRVFRIPHSGALIGLLPKKSCSKNDKQMIVDKSATFIDQNAIYFMKIVQAVCEIWCNEVENS